MIQPKEVKFSICIFKAPVSFNFYNPVFGWLAVCQPELIVEKQFGVP